jgi:hypothetical protein
VPAAQGISGEIVLAHGMSVRMLGRRFSVFRDRIMQNTVRCPSCKAILVVPPLPPEGDFACPRCRARVPLTATAPPTSPVGASSAVTGSPPRANPETVQPDPVGDRRPPEITGGAHPVSVILAILGFFCVMALAVMFGNQGSIRQAGVLAFLFGCLAILAVVQLVIWIRRILLHQGELETLQQVRLVFLGFGCFVLVVVAAVAFFFATCVALK